MVIDNAEVYNSTLNYTDLTGTVRQIEEMKIDNSYINLNAFPKGKLTLISCDISNTTFEGVACSNYGETSCTLDISSGNNTIYNSKFLNIWGIPDGANNFYNSAIQGYYGIIMGKNTYISGCSFENTSIHLASIISENTHSSMNNSYLSFNGNSIDENNSIILANINFNNCSSRNIKNSSWTVKFVNCYGEYENFFGTTNKIISLKNIIFRNCITRQIPGSGNWTVRFINCSTDDNFYNYFGSPRKEIL